MTELKKIGRTNYSRARELCLFTPTSHIIHFIEENILHKTTDTTDLQHIINVAHKY